MEGIELGKAAVEILIDLGKMAATLKLVKKRVAMELKRAGEMGKAAFAKSIRGIGKALKTALLGVGALGAAVTAGAGLALHASNQLNTAMANVASLGSEAAAHVSEWKGELQALSVQMGKTTDDLAGGLYQTVSAFGPVNDAMQILAINAKAATAGLAQTTDAINLTSAVTKAYGDISAKAVQQVSDLALKTVQLGQTTFPELAQSIGRVTPLAASMQMSMQDLFAVLATATGVTGNAAEVSTQMRAALSALMAPTDALAKLYQKLGYANGQAMLKSLGFGGAMKAIVEAAKKSGRPLQDFIGQVRGQVLALALANGLSDQYTEKLEAMQHAAGATDEAFRAQTQGISSVAFQLKQLKQRAVVFLQKAGDALAPFAGLVLSKLVPALDAGATKIEAVLEAFHDLLTGSRSFAEIHDNLTKVFGNEMGNAIFGFMDDIRQLVNGLREGGLMGNRFRDALERVGGSGAVAAFDAIVNGVTMARDALTNLWNVAEPFITGTVIPFVQRHGPAIAAAIAAIGAALAAAAIVSTIIGIAGAIAALVNPVTLVLALIGLLTAAWVKDWGGIREVVKSTASAVSNTLAGVWAVLERFGRAIWETVAPAFDAIGKQLLQAKALLAGLPVANLRKAFTSLGQIVRRVAVLLGGLLLAALGVIVGAIRGVVQGIAWALPGLVLLFNGVALVIQGVIDTIAGAVNALWALVRAALGKGSWDEVLAALRQLWSGVVEILSGLAESFLGILYALLFAAIGLISGFVEGVIGFFVNLYDELVGHSIVPDMLHAMLNVFVTVLSAIVTFVGSWVAGILRGIGQLAGDGVAKVTKFVNEVHDVISKRFDEAKEAITRAVTDARDAVEEKFSNIVRNVKSKIGEIKKALDIADDLRAIGEGLINGLWNGMRSIWKRMKDWLADSVSTLLEIVRLITGTHSPSRKFAEIGRYWMEGLAKGISDAAALPKNALMDASSLHELPIWERDIALLSRANEGRMAAQRNIYNSQHNVINAPGLDAEALMNLLYAQRVLGVMEVPE